MSMTETKPNVVEFDAKELDSFWAEYERVMYQLSRHGNGPNGPFDRSILREAYLALHTAKNRLISR